MPFFGSKKTGPRAFLAQTVGITSTFILHVVNSTSVSRMNCLYHNKSRKKVKHKMHFFFEKNMVP